MDEKLYEVRRREEKSISFGLIKRPQRKGLLSVPLKGLSAYPYVGCAGQVALQIIATPSAALLSIHQPVMCSPTYLFQNGKI